MAGFRAMGRDAVCPVEIDGRCAEARVLLESDHVAVRGTLRQRIPLGPGTTLDVDGETLRLGWEGRVARLHLGAAEASRWALRIRNPPSRARKLGLAEGQRVLVLAVDDDAIAGEVRGAGATLATRRGQGPYDLVITGVRAVADLDNLSALESVLADKGAIWVVWTKGQKNLGEGHVRDAAGAAGLVDVKVMAFSERLSALQLRRRRT